MILNKKTMEDVVIQRIKKFREVLKVSLPKFSETIGVEYRTVNQYMNGERKPSLRFICSILCAYEDLSSEWLLRGEGHMMKTESGGLGHTRGIMSSDGPENKNDFFEFANSIIKQL